MVELELPFTEKLIDGLKAFKKPCHLHQFGRIIGQDLVHRTPKATKLYLNCISVFISCTVLFYAPSNHITTCAIAWLTYVDLPKIR